MKRAKEALRRMLRLFSPRSGGVPVRRRTYRAIARGDEARDRYAWQAAADAYALALAEQPELGHVWVQYGHALKEAGQASAAIDAYREGVRRAKEGADPLIHLGHLLKANGDPLGAAHCFVAGLEITPDNAALESELVRLLPQQQDADPALWNRACRALGLGTSERGENAPAEEDVGLVLDVTDLVAHLGRSTLLTGIQRVQMEVSRAALELARSGETRLALCVYAPLRKGWIVLDKGRFAALCEAACGAIDLAADRVTTSLRDLHRAMAVSRTAVFRQSATIVNLGTSWSDPDYLSAVHAERARSGLRYVAFVYDVIPLRSPDWFLPTLVSDFRRWFLGLLDSADVYIAISDATARDLRDVAQEHGRPIPHGRVATVRLDGDFRSHRAPSGVERLADLHVRDGRYVLFVSTVEPRKNHQGAIAAWRLLARRVGEHTLLPLVCVGGRGWLSDATHRALEEDPFVRRHVRLLSGIGDTDLALLYERCAFTLYPSLYEGWGLPITEALCYGKVPVTSNTSSMPEAGGRWARYFDPRDPVSIADAVEPMLDAAERARAEAPIATDFRPRSWVEIAEEVLRVAQGLD